MELIARNEGTGAVVAGDNFDLTVALSQDIQFDATDYILRQVNMGGGANSLGLGLLPNETVTVDWVQMLPDNFEGDYYILTTINQSQILFLLLRLPSYQSVLRIHMRFHGLQVAN